MRLFIVCAMLLGFACSVDAGDRHKERAVEKWVATQAEQCWKQQCTITKTAEAKPRGEAQQKPKETPATPQSTVTVQEVSSNSACSGGSCGTSGFSRRRR